MKPPTNCVVFEIVGLIQKPRVLNATNDNKRGTTRLTLLLLDCLVAYRLQVTTFQIRSSTRLISCKRLRCFDLTDYDGILLHDYSASLYLYLSQMSVGNHCRTKGGRKSSRRISSPQDFGKRNRRHHTRILSRCPVVVPVHTEDIKSNNESFQYSTRF